MQARNGARVAWPPRLGGSRSRPRACATSASAGPRRGATGGAALRERQFVPSGRAASRRRGARRRVRRPAAWSGRRRRSAATLPLRAARARRLRPRAHQSATSRPLLRSRSMARWCASVNNQVREARALRFASARAPAPRATGVLEYLVDLRRVGAASNRRAAVQRQAVARVEPLERRRLRRRAGRHQRVIVVVHGAVAHRPRSASSLLLTGKRARGDLREL